NASSHPHLPYDQRVLLHVRPVSTIRPRILAVKFGAFIRSDQHRLHRSIAARSATNPTTRQPYSEFRICLASSGSRLDIVYCNLFRDRPHAFRARCATGNIRTGSRLRPLTIARNHIVWSSKPRCGSSLRCRLNLDADREHCWDLTVRASLLPLSQQSAIIDSRILPRLVQADTYFLDRPVPLILHHSLLPLTTPRETDHPHPRGVTYDESLRNMGSSSDSRPGELAVPKSTALQLRDS